jgi:hypothetical protein
MASNLERRIATEWFLKLVQWDRQVAGERSKSPELRKYHHEHRGNGIG